MAENHEHLCDSAMMNSSYFEENKVSNLIIKLRVFFIFRWLKKADPHPRIQFITKEIDLPETFQNRSIYIGNLAFLKVTLHHRK